MFFNETPYTKLNVYINFLFFWCVCLFCCSAFFFLEGCCSIDFIHLTFYYQLFISFRYEYSRAYYLSPSSFSSDIENDIYIYVYIHCICCHIVPNHSATFSLSLSLHIIIMNSIKHILHTKFLVGSSCCHVIIFDIQTSLLFVYTNNLVFLFNSPRSISNENVSTDADIQTNTQKHFPPNQFTEFLASFRKCFCHGEL